MPVLKRWGKPASILLVGMLLGALGGWFAPRDTASVVRTLRQSDLTDNSEYRFIDPLLGLKTTDTAPSSEYKALQDSVQHTIDAAMNAGTLEMASVNFRDMSISAGFVIDPEEQYAPASLFKVPTMMSFFKLAEKNPPLLNQKLTYSGNNRNEKESIESPVQLIPGHVYTIEELIERMIKYSDNNAARMLGDYLNSTGNENAANDLVRDLGITQIEYGQDFITIRGFTLFFRVLYNSTYLSRDDSERALEILSETDFKDGLVAGLAAGTPVAHKFGEFSLLNTDGMVLKRELHDCGIIYYPDHPYLLCVMTKGSDFTQLEHLISGISATVYAEIKAKYK